MTFKFMSSRKKAAMAFQLQALVAAAAESPSEQNLVKLLDAWSRGWKLKGRVSAVGPAAYEKYCTLGLSGVLVREHL